MEEEVVMEQGEKNNKNSLKKIIIAIIVIAIVAIIITGIVNAVKPTPEKTVKKFIEYIDKGKVSEAYKLVDLKGMVLFPKLDEEDYKEFKDEYKGFDEDWEDIEDDAKEDIDEVIEELEDDIDDFEEFDVEIKTKKLKSRKVGKSGILYSVKVKAKTVIKTDGDAKTQRDTEDYVFYLMKKNKKYYVVGITGSGDLTEFMYMYR
ncbi:MAG: hypothetical protein HFJ45_09235 [Clostridia bacterium]|nr:hypothetical protein [Clostridia bacterium]